MKYFRFLFYGPLYFEWFCCFIIFLTFSLVLLNTLGTSYNKKEIIFSVITVWKEAVWWRLSKKHSQEDRVLVVPTRSTGRSATIHRKGINSFKWLTFLWHVLGMSAKICGITAPKASCLTWFQRQPFYKKMLTTINCRKGKWKHYKMMLCKCLFKRAAHTD